MISDDDLRERLETISEGMNSTPETRGNPPKTTRRGDPGFDELMDELESEWEFSEEELDDIAEIRRAGDSFQFRLKGETKWESLEDGQEEKSEETEDEEDNDSCRCYDDCSCDEDPCECDPCECGDGCACCCCKEEPD